MITLDTAWRYILKGPHSGPSIKTGISPVYDLEKIIWPQSILTSDIYENTDGTINFKQGASDNRIRVKDLNLPELTEAKEAMSYSIGHNVTKNFWFRIHHSNYPVYSGEIYVMAIEDDSFLNNYSASLSTYYHSIKDSDDGAGNELTLSFGADDDIKIYPYKIIQSKKVATHNIQTYLFGHPDEWPDFIKQSGAVSTRPIFARQTKEKKYKSCIPSEVQVSGTGYRYFQLPLAPEGLIHAVVNGEYRYASTGIKNTTDFNATDGLATANNHSELRINGFESGWCLATYTMKNKVCDTRKSNMQDTGYYKRQNILEQKVYIVGENDRYSGAQFVSDILNSTHFVEGSSNPENFSQAVLENSYENSWIEAGENPGSRMTQITIADSNMAPKSSISDTSKLRCFVTLIKGSENYLVNIDYEEMLPNNGNSRTDITNITLDVETEYLANKPYRFVGFDNTTLNGMIFYRSIGYTATLAVATFDGYYVIDDTLYDSNGNKSGFQLYTENAMASWGVNPTTMDIRNEIRPASKLNTNGKLIKTGSVTVTLPYAAIN